MRNAERPEGVRDTGDQRATAITSLLWLRSMNHEHGRVFRSGQPEMAKAGNLSVTGLHNGGRDRD